MNSPSKINLKFKCIQTMQGCSNIALLVVTDEKETRQINIVCDGYTRLQFLVRMNALDPKQIRFQADETTDEEEDIFGNKVPEEEEVDGSNDLAGKEAAKSPEQMLPETLVAMLQYLSSVQLESYIYNVYDGEYRAVVKDNSTGTTFPIRACDAVLLTLVNKHIPLTIDQFLWFRQSVPYNKDQQGVSIPINTLSVPMLKDALKRAIDEERYESAEQLKKELEKRELRD